uniref:PSI domain-containing protein n=1 Tax=Arcella intermedia TaxID=1963864 RepID=A0A6B2LLE3_9EUKA
MQFIVSCLGDNSTVPVSSPTPQISPSPDNSTLQPTVQPAVQPVVQPAVQPTVQPAVQPDVQPTVQPTLSPQTAPQDAPAVDNSTDICYDQPDCGACSVYSYCVWCATNQRCWPGSGIGISVPGIQCDDWRWKQCAVSGMIVAILLGVAALIIILTLVGCHIYKTFYKPVQHVS